MSFEPAEVYWINDLETMELLADTNRLQILELAMVPRSVSEIAEAMRVPRTRLYHHINLLEGSGMITVAETRPAGALTEKLYQVAAYNFRPSEEFLTTAEPHEQAEAIMTSLLGSTHADFVRAVDDGLVGLSDERYHRRVSLGRRLTTMTVSELESFVADFEELLDKYDKTGDEPNAIPVAILHVVHPSSRQLP